MSLRGGRLERGAELGGYRIEQQIGQGGMGIVYRVTNVALGRVYALKVLAPELAEDEQFRRRFQREVRIAASIDHPNVVGIHYAGEQDGFLFLAMDVLPDADRKGPVRARNDSGHDVRARERAAERRRKWVISEDGTPTSLARAVLPRSRGTP